MSAELPPARSAHAVRGWLCSPARTKEELGPIDFWVNDAFTSVFGEFIDVAPEDYERVTDVTYHGYVNGTRAALRRMLPRRRGAIVQVGSALAYRGIPLQSAYCGPSMRSRGSPNRYGASCCTGVPVWGSPWFSCRR